MDPEEQLRADRKEPSPPSEKNRTRQHPLDWAVSIGASEALWTQVEERVRRRRSLLRRRFALGGAVAALFVLGFLSWRPATPGRDESFVADGKGTPAHLHVPERRILPDGSIVEIKGGSDLGVSFSSAERRVALLRGEVHFQVRKDSTRPFIVDVGGIAVRAVGTAFMVGLNAEKVEVLVTQGSVAVSSAPTGSKDLAASASPLAVVEAGKCVAIERNSTIAIDPPSVRENAVSPEEIDAKLSWRIPRVELSMTPLEEALIVFNRFSRVRIVLADPSIGRMRLSGFLRADNVDVLLRLLEEDHGLKAEPLREGEIVLRMAR